MVVVDTNALIKIFDASSPLSPIRDALRYEKLRIAVSTPILLKYEEVVSSLAGPRRWQDVWSFLTLIDLLYGSVRQIGPDYRFHSIIGDPDDDAFAGSIITSDRYFDTLSGFGYRNIG
jgi:predicted nucleic acid-binding protein